MACSWCLNIRVPLAVSKRSLSLHALFEFVAFSSTLIKLRVILLNIIFVEPWRAYVGVILGFMLNQVIVINIYWHISTFYPFARLVSRRLEHLLWNFSSYFDNTLFFIVTHATTLQQLLGQLNSHVFSLACIWGSQASHEFEVCMFIVSILIVSDKNIDQLATLLSILVYTYPV